MINYEQDEKDIPGVPDDTKYLGDRIDAMHASIAQLAAALARVDPATTVYFAMGAPGAAGGHNDFPQNVRTKLRELVVSVSAACTVTIKIGTANYLAFDTAGADWVVMPLPVTIDAGTDVTVTASAGTLRLAYFTGAPEA